MPPQEDSQQQKIDWGVDNSSVSESIKLKEIHIDESHSVTILDMNTTSIGYIVATVEAPTLEGNVLWLKGKFGLQNGALSLMRLMDSDDVQDYIGITFQVGKVPSDKSSTGYRYEWVLSHPLG